MPTVLRPVIAVLSLAAGLAAQTLMSRGPLVGSPVAIGIDGGSAAGPDATTLVHRSGFANAPVAFPAAPGSPNLQAILAGFGAPALDIDDFSTGRDDVMVDTNGVLDVPPFAWGMFTFSFKNGSVGAPGSRLAAEAAAGAVGGCVFSWILPGSAVPLALQGVLERSHSARELGLATTGTQEVDALDTPIVLGYDQATLATIEPGFAVYFPTPQAIYFTVANGSLAAVPAAWWIQGGAPTPPSGATILRVLKSSPQSPWTSPHVWMSFVQLGLSINEDIDALAVDATGEKILFSCVGNQRDQVLFLYYGTDGGAPVPAKLPNNTPVSQAIGTAQNDEVDAICTLDPHIRTNGGWVPDDFGASCATPRDPYMPGLYPVGMNASAFRRFEAGLRHYDTWMLGYPPATGVGPGYAMLIITIGDLLSPAITATFQARIPTSSVPGDPRSYTLDIPPTYSLVGLPLTFRWFASDAGLVQLAQAYPVKAFL